MTIGKKRVVGWRFNHILALNFGSKILFLASRCPIWAPSGCFKLPIANFDHLLTLFSTKTQTNIEVWVMYSVGLIIRIKRAIEENSQVSKGKFNLSKVWRLICKLSKLEDNYFRKIVDVRGPICNLLEVERLNSVELIQND